MLLTCVAALRVIQPPRQTIASSADIIPALRFTVISVFRSALQTKLLRVHVSSLVSSYDRIEAQTFDRVRKHGPQSLHGNSCPIFWDADTCQLHGQSNADLISEGIGTCQADSKRIAH